MPSTAKSWITPQMRTCQDGGKHEGDLQLITWEWKDEYGEEMGWGNIIREEADDLKQRFEKEMGKNEKKLFDYWPAAFRWTCCGASAQSGDPESEDISFGCDHHGTGSTKCSCDFCQMGQPVPASVLKPINVHGLNISPGPDPRSFKASTAAFNEGMREVFGLPKNLKPPYAM